MTKKINLIGKKFEKLTVISEAPNINPKNKSGRSFTAWNCQCECGKIIIIRSGTLLNRLQKSCGCLVYKFGLAIKPNTVFNKLTTISYDNGYWDCLCECGNKTTVLTNHLISGNTKSCGCIKSYKAKNNIKKAINASTKYTPSIASARRVWKQYCYRDKECNLSFDEWFKISQQNCYYCQAKPNKIFNSFLKKKGASEYAIKNGDFIYNGIDRVDSSLSYIHNNVVACCYTCNRAKSNRSLHDFYRYIDNLNTESNLNIKKLELPNGYLLVSVKGVFRHYIRNYKQMEIDLKLFYNYSQCPCYYCGVEKSNYYNVYLKDKQASDIAKNSSDYYYNGIDRLDNSKGHTIDNIVPCCKYCNFAKSNLSLSEFYDWIKRVKDFQKK